MMQALLTAHYELLLGMFAKLPPDRVRDFLIEAAVAAGEDMDVVNAIIEDIEARRT